LAMLLYEKDYVIDLTDEQVEEIRKWAAKTPLVQEVRLFGSRAKGTAHPDSDVDLAITVGGSERGSTSIGNYFAKSNEWKDDLTRRIGLKVHLNLYNEEGSYVRQRCDECSELLYPRGDVLSRRA